MGKHGGVRVAGAVKPASVADLVAWISEAGLAAADEAVDGVDTPLPSPDRASATMISRTDGSAPTWVKTSIDTHRAAAPATIDQRSPTLTAA